MDHKKYIILKKIMTDILVDIGGTYIRFAKGGQSGPVDIKKWHVRDFKSFDQALRAYAKSGTVYIASTGIFDQTGSWRITNGAGWQINPADISASGFQLGRILNDFDASSAALCGLSDDELRDVYASPSPPRNNKKMLVGAGTGLGLAYCNLSDRHLITDSCDLGGHMAASAITPEQFDICQKISQELQKPVIYEDMASGRGLANIYKAVTGHNSKSPEKAVEHPNVLRLFHEFLGLFIHQAIIFSSSFGGVYLTGGVIDKLIEKEIFDTQTVLRYIHIKGAPVVNDILTAVPVYYITTPYLTLHGLYNKFIHHEKSLSDH